MDAFSRPGPGLSSVFSFYNGVATAMADKPKLLVVDDDEDLRTQMRWALADDYEVLLAGDRAAAVEAVRDSLPRW